MFSLFQEFEIHSSRGSRRDYLRYAYCHGDIVVYKSVDYVVSSLSRLPFFLLTSLESSPAILTELSSSFQAGKHSLGRVEREPLVADEMGHIHVSMPIFLIGRASPI